MKIAVDIDDTLSTVDRLGRAGAYIEKKGLPFKVKDPDSHYFVEVYNWREEDVLAFMRDGGITAFTDAPVRKGAKETLGSWRAAGHEVIILTARLKSFFTNPEKVSRDWLEKRRIPYDGLVAEIEDKGAYCKEHGISVLVDDNLENCLRAQSLGVHAVLAVGKNNVARAHEVAFGGANWKQIDAAVRFIAAQGIGG